MPMVLVDHISYDETNDVYWLSLKDAKSYVPHIKEYGSISFYILQIKDEADKPIKRTNPLEKMTSTVRSQYDGIFREFVPVIQFSPYQAEQLNIGNNYTIAILITEYNGRAILPLEIKPVTHNAEEIIKHLHMEIDLLTFTLNQPKMQNVMRYLLEANMHFGEGAIEEARTDLRNSLESLRDDLIKEIIPTPGFEDEKIQDKLTRLVNGIMGFLSYGGPHPGPASIASYQTAFNITVEIIKYLAKSLENKTLNIQEKEEK
ncbi:MAG: hypothetical protein ACPLYF_04545 [Fervidobacterium sp.]